MHQNEDAKENKYREAHGKNKQRVFVVPGSLLGPDSSILRESQKLIINRKNKQGFS